MRKAMGLIQAIMIILVVSGMMLIVLKYASVSSRHIADTYIKEQNQLFLQSAIEQTLLKISFHDRSTACLANDMIPYSPTTVTKRGVTYSATVNIRKYYLQTGSPDLVFCTGTGDPVQDIGIEIELSSNNSHGMALLEIVSTATKDGDIVSRILRRTLQQP